MWPLIAGLLVSDGALNMETDHAQPNRKGGGGQDAQRGTTAISKPRAKKTAQTLHLQLIVLMSDHCLQHV
jgi:hypothetical protein